MADIRMGQTLVSDFPVDYKRYNPKGIEGRGHHRLKGGGFVWRLKSRFRLKPAESCPPCGLKVEGDRPAPLGPPPRR